GGVGGLADLAVEGGDGGGVDDDPAFGRARGLVGHRIGRGDGLGGQPDDVERADEVDGHDLLEGGQGQDPVASEDLARGGDAGAGDHQAQRGQCGGGLDGRADLVLVGDVGGDAPGALPQPGGDVPTGGGGQVEQAHVGPGVMECPGGGGTQAGRATGDEGRGPGDLH